MSALETAYRRAMQWYPHRWREENADALVALMIEVAEGEGRSTPSTADLRNLRANGLRARLAPLGRVFPAEARDRASSTALGFGFGITLAMLILQEWAPWATESPWWPLSPPIGPFHGWGGVLYSVWAIAAVLALARLNLAARVLLALTVPFSLILIVVAPVADEWFRPSTLALAIMSSFAVIVALGRPVNSARSYPLLAASFALGAGLVVYPFALYVEFTTLIPPRWIWSMTLQGTEASNAAVAIAVGVIALVCVVRNPRWLATIALLSLPALILGANSLSSTNAELVVLVGAFFVVIGAVLALVTLRVHGFRIAVVRRD